MSVLHQDDFVNDRSAHRLVLRADGKDFLLNGVDADAGPKSGSTVRVAGAEQGASIEVSAITSLAAPSASASAAPATGARATAVVLFNFADNAQRPFTAADALTRVFTGADSANAFYQESSNGALSLVGKNSPAGDVLGWYTIPQTASVCDQVRWAESVRSAAASSGHDLTSYDNVVYVFPRVPACPWGGWGYIGDGPAGMGEAWSNGYLDTGLITHELGHNFGMNHASTLSCSADGRRVTVAEGCLADEYGDPFDVMGKATLVQRGGNYYGRHPHSLHLEQADLLPASAVTTITSSGDYAVTAGELETGTRSLRIPLPGLPGWYYYLDVRIPEGRFDDFPVGAPAVSGVTFRLSPDARGYGGSYRSYLLDATPETATFDDAPLPVGREFFDPGYARSAMTVVSITGGVAVVHVDFDILGASVVNVDPPSTMGGVALDNNVVLTFSGPVDPASVENAFALLQLPTTKVSGAFRWNPTSTVVTFDPASYLLPRTGYGIVVGSGAKDASGRPLSPWPQTSFFTDGSGPRVASIDPLASAVGIPVDRNVAITFKAPVARTSAQAAFTLRRAGTTVNLGGTFSWDTSSTVMTFDPYASLAAGFGYDAAIAPTVKDAVGNVMAAGYASSFTTSGSAASVVGVEPPAGTPEVAVDRNVIVRFSTPMERYSTQAAFSLRKVGTLVNLGGSFTWNATSTVMTVDPYANLAARSGYTISVAPSAMNAARDPFGGAFTSDFNTDGQAPSIATVDPAAGTGDVAVTGNVVVTFSEPLERNSAQAAFTLRRVGTTVNIGGSFSWNTASTVMTFDPYANLAAGFGFTVDVAASVKDIAGIPMTGAFAAGFTTVGQPASVAGVAPAAGSTGVSADRNVVVTFSQAMERNSAQVAFSLRKAGTTNNLGGAFLWNPTSTVMTFDPYANLAGATEYNVSVASSAMNAARDPFGVAFTSSFTTDGQAPSVVAVDPAAAATDVAVNRNVVVTFSEPVERTSAQSAFSLRKAGTTVNLGGGFLWNTASTVMTFDPYANLLANSNYSVVVAASVRDVAGNVLAPAFASTFTSDAQAPTVVVGASGGATGVPVARDVVVTFSEPMERTSAQAAFALRKAGTTINLAGAFTWDAASTVMTFNPYVNLNEASPYTVAVTASAKDLAGNPLAADTGWVFTTDGQAPSVIAVDPAAAATDVAVNRNVVVTFSEPVARYSAQNAFSLRKAGTTVNLGGAFTWNTTSTVMTFDPYANLLADSSYVVAVAASVTDATSNAAAAAFTSGFTTAR